MSEAELITKLTREYVDARRERNMARELLRAFARELAPVVTHLEAGEMDRAAGMLSEEFVVKYSLGAIQGLLARHSQAASYAAELQVRLRSIGIDVD